SPSMPTPRSAPRRPSSTSISRRKATAARTFPRSSSACAGGHRTITKTLWPGITTARLSLLRRIGRRPQLDRRGLLVGHALRIGDDLHLQAPGRKEIGDGLAGSRTLIDRERPEHRLHALAVQVILRRLHVVDIEGDV